MNIQPSNEPEKKGILTKITDYLTGKGFYKVIAASLAVIAIAGWFVADRVINYNKLVNDGEGDITSLSTSVPAEVTTSNAAEYETGKSDSLLNIPQSDTTHAAEQTNATPSEKSQETDNSTTKALFILPVSGETQKEYSGDAPVFSETFVDWRVHSGVDIKGELGTPVKAASSGTVILIDNDPIWGTTVKIKHSDNLVSIYSNLGTKPTITAGQKVSVGDVIGSIGQTAQAEIAQDPHLHFAVTENAVYIDPMSIISAMSKKP